MYNKKHCVDEINLLSFLAVSDIVALISFIRTMSRRLVVALESCRDVNSGALETGVLCNTPDVGFLGRLCFLFGFIILRFLGFLCRLRFVGLRCDCDSISSKSSSDLSMLANDNCPNDIWLPTVVRGCVGDSSLKLPQDNWLATERRCCVGDSSIKLPQDS